MPVNDGTPALHGRAFIGDAIQDDILVVIRDGAIASIDQVAKPPRDAVRVDGVIVPGFIDVHVHGGNGADFMDADPDRNRSIVAFHARHGTTALMATTLSASRPDLRNAIAAMRGIDGIAGIHLEGPYINERRAGAQDRASIRVPDPHELGEFLAMAPDSRWMMTIAPELPGAHQLIAQFRDRVLFSIGHTNGSHAETVAALEWGAQHFTHLFNAMTPFNHREPGVAGAALASSSATAELIADGIHVHPAALWIAARALPYRIALVTDAMRACGLSDGTYKLYEHEVTVSEGAARLADGTLAGSVLTMDAAVKNMVELAGLPIEYVLPLASAVPAKIAGVADRKGRIAAGYDADLAVLNERLECERVLVRGHEVGDVR